MTSEPSSTSASHRRPASRSTTTPEDSPTGLSAGTSPNPNIQVHHPLCLVQKYHNESNIVFGGKNEEDNEEDEKKKLQERKKKEEELNNRLPEYDPKMGGKSSLKFGENVNEENMNSKMRNPPGGKSNIQFG